MRQKWLVLAVEQADHEHEQDEAKTVWRVRVRSPEKTEPTYVVYVSQARERAVPYLVGGCMELDPRLLEQE